MPLSTPDFWYEKDPDIKATLLAPLASLYGFGRALAVKRAKAPYKSSLPVICVGNITAGGSGKTPAVRALMALIHHEGLYEKPCFLTRGYGGLLPGPVLANLDDHSALTIGDEAMLLAGDAPTIVSLDRAKGAKLAEELGFDLILMDDGMQNLSLHKDITFCVVDGTAGFGNGKLLPAGPLREHLATGLERSTAVLVVNPKEPITLPLERPLVNGRVHIVKGEHFEETMKGKKYLAFAGLGQPWKFFMTAKNAGLDIVQTRPLPDHTIYTPKLMDDLKSEAKREGLSLLTTEKDAVKIEDAAIDVLKIELVFEDTAAVLSILKGT